MKAGVAADDAKAAAESVAQADHVATKADLADVRGDIRVLQTEMRQMRWMIGLVLGVCIAIFVRSFF